MKTMIVFLGEKKMHCGTKRKKKMDGGRVTYGKGGKAKKDGNAAARRDYNGAMRTCMPN